MTLDYEKSCSVLNISTDNENDISSKILNRQYRKMSLLYHPDKNLDISSDKFLEINDAYQYLGKYLGYMDDDNDSDNEDEIHWTVNYKNKIVEFFDGTIVNQVISMNEGDIINYLKTVDKKKIIYLYKMLYLNRNKLNIPDSLLSLLSNVLRGGN